MGWAGKRNFQALPLTLAKVVPSGLTPPFIQRRIIPFKAKGTEERNRLKGSPPPAAVPQAGPSPRRAGQQGGRAGPLPAAASGGRLAATGRGTGGGRGGWAQRRRRVPRSPPGSAFPARTRSLQPKVCAPPPFSGSTGLAPPSHISNSQGQLVTGFRSWGFSLSPSLCFLSHFFCLFLHLKVSLGSVSGIGFSLVCFSPPPPAISVPSLRGSGLSAARRAHPGNRPGDPTAPGARAGEIGRSPARGRS